MPRCSILLPQRPCDRFAEADDNRPPCDEDRDQQAEQDATALQGTPAARESTRW